MFARRMEGVSVITMENEGGGRSRVFMIQERGEYAGRFEKKNFGSNSFARCGVPGS